jgi:hypothetical protein
MSLAKFPLSAGISYRGDPVALLKRQGMDLRCPSCNGADLKKVSLAFQEGMSRVKTSHRLLGLVFGHSCPGLLIGGAAGRGLQQTELSRTLKPPVKWSYLKLTLRSVFVTFVAFGGYVLFVAASTPPVSTLPMKLYVFLAPVVFVALAFSFWLHNHTTFPREYAQWNRSFICQRCGTVSLHDIPPSSIPRS